MLQIKTKCYIDKDDFLFASHRQWVKQQLKIIKDNLLDLFKADEDFFEFATINLDGFTNDFSLLFQFKNNLRLAFNFAKPELLLMSKQDLVPAIKAIYKGFLIPSHLHHHKQILIHYDLNDNYFSSTPNLTYFSLKQPIFKYSFSQMLKIINYYQSLNELIYWWSSKDFYENKSMKDNFNQLISQVLNCNPDNNIELLKIESFNCNSQDEFELVCQIKYLKNKQQVKLKLTRAQLLTITDEDLNEVHYYLKHWNWNAIDDFKLVDFPTDSGKLLNLILQNNPPFVNFYHNLMTQIAHKDWIISANWNQFHNDYKPWGWAIIDLKPIKRALYYTNYEQLGLNPNLDNDACYQQLTTWIKILKQCQSDHHPIKEIVYDQLNNRIWILTTKTNLPTIEWVLDHKINWNQFDWKQQLQTIFNLHSSVVEDVKGSKLIINGQSISYKNDQNQINELRIKIKNNKLKI